MSPTPIRAEAGALPEGELSFYNVHTDERLRVRYRDERGRYDLSALDDLNHILRCHHTGEVAAMDPRVIEHLNLVQKTLGGEGEIHVISGYRSPEYNAILVKRSRRAARHSLHVEGQADLRCLEEVGIDEPTVKDMYRLLALSRYGRGMTDMAV